MDITRVSQKLHAFRLSQFGHQRGRKSHIQTAGWDELSDEERESYALEIDEVLKALEECGYIVYDPEGVVMIQKRVPVLRVTRMPKGQLVITKGAE